MLQNLDNFQQPTERAVEKCQRLSLLVHYEMRNFKMKSVKSFAGHPVFQDGLWTFTNDMLKFELDVLNMKLFLTEVNYKISTDSTYKIICYISL